MSFSPSFFVIGAQKAGTTALHHYLSQHPQLFLPSVKETHFFSSHHGEYDYGLEFYLDKYFCPASSETLAGEVDPEYLHNSFVAERLASAFPDAKIVAVLRNPIDRAYSHYQMTYTRGRESEDFESALRLEEGRLAGASLRQQSDYAYRQRGFYYQQLCRFRERFEPHQIKIIFSADLLSRPQTIADDLHNFLGLPPRPLIPISNRRRNRASLPISLAVARYMQTDSRLRSVARSSLPRPLRRFVHRTIDFLNRRPGRFPPLPDATRRRLRKVYATDIRELELWLGKDLSSWR